ncbi:MAG TPA: Crp/Fnr family transcriptional regulator [Polaromonas sp.]|uniref:Crp/Fnr family transcriptional regulator n=1 Tax=Polaromonas sp. TaxID=1869339 RepID=UPI002D30762B|nr:Crp/Fnr family transcriptional regulator [Polaromonas sp.]HYW57798.1 Crp/Fnr family transcriptional regulator [Polaromonas sp.]
MNDELPLGQVLEQTPWYTALDDDEQQLVQRTSSEKLVSAGGFIVRAGDPSIHWMGVIKGLVQMSVSGSDGRETTLGCVEETQWCGEGSLLKREPRRYDAIALRHSRIALVPIDTFLHLRKVSLPFNHYLQDLMNARMSSFIATLEADRLLGPEQRVATCVATLCRHMQGDTDIALDITQHDLAMICGLSRQRTNACLQVLVQLGHIRVEFKSIQIVNLAALTAYGNAID